VARIMVVDDAAFMRLRLSTLLQEAGHTVIEAENGAQAVERYRQERPDVVLMDITMPVMDGLAAIDAIRSQDPGARIIVCSSLGQQAMVMRAIRSGARDFVVKPFQPERVLGAVARALGE
jgi:two-component system chemotaxis response regulator CheY